MREKEEEEKKSLMARPSLTLLRASCLPSFSLPISFIFHFFYLKASRKPLSSIKIRSEGVCARALYQSVSVCHWNLRSKSKVVLER